VPSEESDEESEDGVDGTRTLPWKATPSNQC
jgi:hypothetical protein